MTFRHACAPLSSNGCCFQFIRHTHHRMYSSCRRFALTRKLEVDGREEWRDGQVEVWQAGCRDPQLGEALCCSVRDQQIHMYIMWLLPDCVRAWVDTLHPADFLAMKWSPTL